MVFRRVFKTRTFKYFQYGDIVIKFLVRDIEPQVFIYCHVYGVTMEGVWIGNWIYWTVLCSPCLYFIVPCYTHTLVCSVFFTAVAR
jgi:hypothetical protein